MKAIENLLLCFALAIVGCGKEPVETFDSIMAEGKKAFVDQDYATARGYFLKAYEVKPSDKDVLYFLGISYARDMVYDSAFSFLRRAEILHSGDREVNLELYPLAVALEEWTQAIISVRVLIATGDPPSKYFRDMAELHAAKGQYGGAYRYMRQELEQKPDDTEIYLKLSELARLADTAILGVAILDTALEKFGRIAPLLAARASALADAGLYLQAEIDFRDLLGEGYDNSQVKLGLASALMPQNSREKRMEAYRIMTSLRDSMAANADFDSVLKALEDSLGLSSENSREKK